jgi:hypothetical protein
MATNKAIKKKKGKHVSERYTKLREERDFRMEWAERIGPGFDVPPSIGQLRLVPKVA